MVGLWAVGIIAVRRGGGKRRLASTLCHNLRVSAGGRPANEIALAILQHARWEGGGGGGGGMSTGTFTPDGKGRWGGRDVAHMAPGQEDIEPAFTRPSSWEEVQVEDGDEPISDDEDGAGPAPSTAAADSAAATDSTNQLIATRPIKTIVRHG